MKKILILGCALGLMACDDKKSTTDTGTSADTNRDTTQTGDTSTVADPFACQGVDPTNGAAFDATLFAGVSAGGTLAPITGSKVYIQKNNNPKVISNDADCLEADGCFIVTTDSMGRGLLNLATGSFLSYYIPGATGSRLPTVGMNVRASDAPPPATEDVTLTSVTAAAASLLGTTGYNFDMTKGHITGAIRGCDGNPVSGARVRVFQGTNVVAPGASGSTVGYIYWQALPQSNAALNQTDASAGGGRYTVVNLTAAAEGTRYRIEVYHNYSMTGAVGTPKVAGCEEIVVFPGAATIFTVGPKRPGAPSSCSTTVPAGV